MNTVTLRTGKGEHLTYHQVRVRELTVAEVREWLNDSQGTGYRDPIHALALPEIGLDELARMTDRTASELEAFAPSELQLLADAARELNPFFFSPAKRAPDGDARASRRDGAAALDQNLCRLISDHGHANVLTYPWRLYLAAIDVANARSTQHG